VSDPKNRRKRLSGIVDRPAGRRLADFKVPPSSFLARKTLRSLSVWAARRDRLLSACPHDPSDVLANRHYWDANFAIPLVARLRRRYRVKIQPRQIAGVYTDVVVPASRLSAENKARILINLHGGGFITGARHGGRIESIPIAAIGKIPVVSIDYRMAPESTFPAATEDVMAVYRALLGVYQPSSTGIFGCSAGAVLAAEAVALMLSKRLPLPGAIGMFCGAASFWSEGDTGHFRPLFAGAPLEGSRQHPYFRNADPDSPLVFPARSSRLLGRFPPSLLVSGTRDHALSSVAHTHSCLVTEGVEAHLHVWEGLGHAFFFDSSLRESGEFFQVATQFFIGHLNAHELRRGDGGGSRRPRQRPPTAQVKSPLGVDLDMLNG
jgi:epsilon-lactone hydrolase